MTPTSAGTKLTAPSTTTGFALVHPSFGPIGHTYRRTAAEAVATLSASDGSWAEKQSEGWRVLPAVGSIYCIEKAA